MRYLRVKICGPRFGAFAAEPSGPFGGVDWREKEAVGKLSWL